MEYEILKNDRIFDEFFQIDRVQLRHENFKDDQWSTVRRYNLNRPEAVAVILENTETGKIILVEQFRYASLKKSERNGWMQEIIAGLIDPGETPLESAKRETMEETGYHVNNLEHVTDYFASVGICDELIHLYYGQVTSKDRIEQGGGVETESEDLLVMEVDFSELMQRLKNNEIKDSKTIIALQWLALKKHTTP